MPCAARAPSSGPARRSGLTELVEVGSMHERKQAMFELADTFVACPAAWARWRS